MKSAFLLRNEANKINRKCWKPTKFLAGYFFNEFWFLLCGTTPFTLYYLIAIHLTSPLLSVNHRAKICDVKIPQWKLPILKSINPIWENSLWKVLFYSSELLRLHSQKWVSTFAVIQILHKISTLMSHDQIWHHRKFKLNTSWFTGQFFINKWQISNYTKRKSSPQFLFIGCRGKNVGKCEMFRRLFKDSTRGG